MFERRVEGITAKEKMLKSIRRALIEKTDNPYPELEFSPIYSENNQTLDIIFAEELNALGGKFVYCQNEIELVESLINLAESKKWTSITVLEEGLQSFFTRFEFPFQTDLVKLKDTDVGISLCESLIARNGGVLLSSGMTSGRQLIALPPVHVVIAHSAQLIMDIGQGLSRLKDKYLDKIPSSITLVTGASRTADIEKTLVMGMHGPRELYVILVEQDVWS